MDQTPESKTESKRLIALLVGFIVVAGPVAGFIWHELSEALLGRPHRGPLLIALALVVFFFIGLSRLGRRLGGGEDGSRSPEQEAP